MNKLFLLTFLIILNSCNTQQVKNRPIEMGVGSSNVNTKENDFYNIKVRTIDSEEVSLSKYKGKKLLILNVASKCGFTPQYADWEKFYAANKEKITVLGFPCNQFMGQESGKNSDIKSFCMKNYGVTFPMFEKIDVKGSKQAPVYNWLTNKSKNGWNEQAPSWNFCKYLINEKGELVSFFASSIKPDNPEFLAALKK
jgi:glutathione peroxidase